MNQRTLALLVGPHQAMEKEILGHGLIVGMVSSRIAAGGLGDVWRCLALAPPFARSQTAEAGLEAKCDASHRQMPRSATRCYWHDWRGFSMNDSPSGANHIRSHLPKRAETSLDKILNRAAAKMTWARKVSRSSLPVQ